MVACEAHDLSIIAIIVHACFTVTDVFQSWKKNCFDEQMYQAIG